MRDGDRTWHEVQFPYGLARPPESVRRLFYFRSQPIKMKKASNEKSLETFLPPAAFQGPPETSIFSCFNKARIKIQSRKLETPTFSIVKILNLSSSFREEFFN